MRYFVTIDGEVIEVDVDGEHVTVGGAVVRVDLGGAAGTAARHLIMDGRSWPLLARAGEHRGVWRIEMGGHAWEAEVIDERTRAIRDMTSGAPAQRGPRPVRAPMPGLVVRVEVEPGQSVRPGQGVVIVEAMKMENELKADGGGVVSRVLVAPGQAVEKGAVLIEFAGSTG